LVVQVEGQVGDLTQHCVW